MRDPVMGKESSPDNVQMTWLVPRHANAKTGNPGDWRELGPDEPLPEPSVERLNKTLIPVFSETLAKLDLSPDDFDDETFGQFLQAHLHSFFEAGQPGKWTKRLEEILRGVLERKIERLQAELAAKKARERRGSLPSGEESPALTRVKDQNFGDVNDYRKYGLLRILADGGKITTGVCWMMTPSDPVTNGELTRYLSEPKKWRGYDPELFDFLKKHAKGRRVSAIEQSGLLPGTSFYSGLLVDDAKAREQYFAVVFQQFAGRDLIVFDPDNGLEVPSARLGKKNSSKYLFHAELRKAYQAGHSVLVCQHFGREKRKGFIKRVAGRVREATEAESLLTFCTPHMLYLLVPRPIAAPYFRERAKAVVERWRDEVVVNADA